jgi:hypothetical protein
MSGGIIMNLAKWGLLVTVAAWAPPVHAADLAKPYAALCAKDYNTAATLSAAAINVEPKNSMAHRYLAAALTGLQKPESALLELRAAQAIDGVQPCDTTIEFKARVGLARLAIVRGDMDKARKMYQFLAAQKPSGTDAVELRSLSRDLNKTQSPPASAPVSAPAQPTEISLKG